MASKQILHSITFLVFPMTKRVRAEKQIHVLTRTSAKQKRLKKTEKWNQNMHIRKYSCPRNVVIESCCRTASWSSSKSSKCYTMYESAVALAAFRMHINIYVEFAIRIRTAPCCDVMKCEIHMNSKSRLGVTS